LLIKNRRLEWYEYVSRRYKEDVKRLNNISIGDKRKREEDIDG